MTEFLHLKNAAGLPLSIRKSHIDIVWEYVLDENNNKSLNPVIVLKTGRTVGISTPYLDIMKQLISDKEYKDLIKWRKQNEKDNE